MGRKLKLGVVLICWAAGATLLLLNLALKQASLHHRQAGGVLQAHSPVDPEERIDMGKSGELNSALQRESNPPGDHDQSGIPQQPRDFGCFQQPPVIGQDEDLSPPPLEDGDALRRWIEETNLKQIVLNEGRYGPTNQVEQVIVVQVHTRINYLSWLLYSLSKVRHIESTLLVVSLDVVDEEILAVTRKVCFCRVMHVFFPQSLQANPGRFPGPSPQDCPRDIGVDQAKMIRCLNADTPDLNGVYREAHIVQPKHHWWWLHNHVFAGIQVLRNFQGPVLFVEEDMYVATDLIHVLRLMRTSRQADLYVMNDGHNNLNKFCSQKAKLSSWLYNGGVALNRSTWQKILGCAQKYCTYDDYNYDYSLQYIAQQCVPGRLNNLVLEGTRVFHTGQCGGLHHQKADNKCMELVRHAQQSIGVLAAKGFLFPAKLVVRKEAGRAVSGPYGGWGDARDHQLCLNMTITRG